MKKIIQLSLFALMVFSSCDAVYADTRSIAPRAAHEGSIGTTIKPWGAGHFDELFVDGNNIYSQIEATNGLTIIPQESGAIIGITPPIEDKPRVLVYDGTNVTWTPGFYNTNDTTHSIMARANVNNFHPNQTTEINGQVLNIFDNSSISNKTYVQPFSLGVADIQLESIVNVGESTPLEFIASYTNQFSGKFNTPVTGTLIAPGYSLLMSAGGSTTNFFPITSITGDGTEDDSVTVQNPLQLGGRYNIFDITGILPKNGFISYSYAMNPNASTNLVATGTQNLSCYAWCASKDGKIQYIVQGIHIMKSYDYGKHWQVVNTIQNLSWRDWAAAYLRGWNITSADGTNVWICPRYADLLVNYHPYVSHDGMQTYTQTDWNDSIGFISDAGENETREHTLFYTDVHSSYGYNFCMSTNSGSTWTSLMSSNICAAAGTPDGNFIAYCVVGNGNTFALLNRSQVILVANTHLGNIAVDENGTIFGVSCGNAFGSHYDENYNYCSYTVDRETGNVTTNFSVPVYDKYQNNSYYRVNGVSIYDSTNYLVGGVNIIAAFSQASDGIANYRIVFGDTMTAGQICYGNHARKTAYSPNLSIDPIYPNIRYFRTGNTYSENNIPNRLWVSTDYGNTWSLSYSLTNQISQFSMPQSYAGVAYWPLWYQAGATWDGSTHCILRSYDYGQTWAPIQGNSARFAALSVNTSNTMYCTLHHGGIYMTPAKSNYMTDLLKSTDGGTNWYLPKGLGCRPGLNRIDIASFGGTTNVLLLEPDHYTKIWYNDDIYNAYTWQSAVGRCNGASYGGDYNSGDTTVEATTRGTYRACGLITPADALFLWQRNNVVGQFDRRRDFTRLSKQNQVLKTGFPTGVNWTENNYFLGKIYTGEVTNFYYGNTSDNSQLYVWKNVDDYSTSGYNTLTGTPTGYWKDLDVVDTNIMWAIVGTGYNTGMKIYKTIDGWQTYTNVSPWLNGVQQTSSGGGAAVCAINSSVCYIAFNKMFYKTIDGGETWEQLPVSFANISGDIVDIECDRNNRNINGPFWVVHSNHGSTISDVPSLYWTTNQFQTIVSYQMYGGGIPEGTRAGWNQGSNRFNSFGPPCTPSGKPNIVYMGQCGGYLWQSKDGGETWVKQTNGIGRTDFGPYSTWYIAAYGDTVIAVDSEASWRDYDINNGNGGFRTRVYISKAGEDAGLEERQWEKLDNYTADDEKNGVALTGVTYVGDSIYFNTGYGYVTFDPDGHGNYIPSTNMSFSSSIPTTNWANIKGMVADSMLPNYINRLFSFDNKQTFVKFNNTDGWESVLRYTNSVWQYREPNAFNFDWIDCTNGVLKAASLAAQYEMNLFKEQDIENLNQIQWNSYTNGFAGDEGNVYVLTTFITYDPANVSAPPRVYKNTYNVGLKNNIFTENNEGYEILLNGTNTMTSIIRSLNDVTTDSIIYYMQQTE